MSGGSKLSEWIDDGTKIDPRDSRDVNIASGKVYKINDTQIAISDLADVDTTSVAPAVDEMLRWNGANWVPGDVPISATTGKNFYNDDTSVIASSSENYFAIETLALAPSGGGEVVETAACATNTVVIDAYLDGVLGVTSIPAGTWTFETYASVNSILAGRVSTITRGIYQVVIDAVNTVTTTGTGTSRTCTASGGTPFAAGDANADSKLCGWVQTPKGLYQITGYTSATEVTISTPSAYVNETGVSLSTWKFLFSSTTDTITNLATDYGLYTHSTVQSAFSINATDALGQVVFGTSNNTTNVSFVYEGTEHYSHFSAPLLTNHNDLAGLQGGTSNEYYHLTSANHTALTAGFEGTGSIVRATSPSLTTPNIGTPSAGVLTSCTGYPGDSSLVTTGTVVSGTWSSNITSATVTNALTLGENASIALDPAGSADGKFTGITIAGTGGETIAFGETVYLKAADSEWYKTDADADATAGAVLVGIAASTSTDGNPITVLTYGQIRADAVFPALTIGAPVYLDTSTAGYITTTAPSGSGDVVKVVGHALTADEILFNPSPDWIVIT